MIKLVLVGVVCLLIGHFGPAASAKWVVRASSTGLHGAGKALDTVSSLAK